MGLGVLAAYAAVMLFCTLLVTRKSSNSEEFCVGDRKTGLFAGSFSIAATWVWAPSLLVAAERAYLQGWVGLFWFTVPNILCLILFSGYAKKIREQMPRGITLSGYMESVYGRRVKGAYLFQLGSLSVLSSAVQLLAGAAVLGMFTGLPFWLLTVLLAAAAYSYSRYSGIRAGIATDVVQMLLILIVSVALALCTGGKLDGLSTLRAGLGGADGRYTSLFSSDGLAVFWTFGLPTTIGLLSGPFGDQCFWQRAFCIEKTKVQKAFVLGALLFGVVPVCMGGLGLLAAGSGLSFVSAEAVNFQLVQRVLPSWVAIPFLFMILSGLLSTLDSNLCAVASLATDVRDNPSVLQNKLAMLLLLALGIGVANIPGLTVTTLFMIYGTLRATTLLPTVLTLNGRKLDGKAVCVGVLAGLCAGLPLFILGTIRGDTLLKVIGCLSAAGLPGVISVFGRGRDGCVGKKAKPDQ